MVLTVTLNPAVDKTYTVGELITGHVNRMRSVMNIAGGKGVNVTKILRQYDVPVCATGFLGGYAGHLIEDRLKEKQVDCRFEWVDGETRSNMNVLADNGFVTELLEPGPDISREALSKFLERYDSLLPDCEMVVLSGSLASGIPEDFYGNLIARAKRQDIRVVLDTSGEALRKGLMAKPYMVKPNQKELEYVIGHRLWDREEVIEAANMLVHNGIQRVVVSMGKKGLLSVTDGQVYFAKAKVQAVNTVACGDSVVASYVMSLLRRDSEEEMAGWAAAISAANATTVESADIPVDVARELYSQIRVERLTI